MLWYYYSPADCLFTDSSASIPEPDSPGSHGGPVRNSIRNQEHNWMKSFTGFQNWSRLKVDPQFDRGIFWIQFLPNCVRTEWSDHTLINGGFFRLSAFYGVSDSLVGFPYGWSVYLFSSLTFSSFHSISLFFSFFFSLTYMTYIIMLLFFIIVCTSFLPFNRNRDKYKVKYVDSEK